MVHPCDKPCGNKTASGYCATTACINPQFSNIGTAQYGKGVQKRIVTNADRLRAMSDEELAELLDVWPNCYLCQAYYVTCDGANNDTNCKDSLIDWLRQEATDAP